MHVRSLDEEFIALNGVFESSLWEPNSQIAGLILNPEGTSSRQLLPLPSQELICHMSTKIVTLEELRQHATKEKLWLLVNGKGLSRSTFL